MRILRWGVLLCLPTRGLLLTRIPVVTKTPEHARQIIEATASADLIVACELFFDQLATTVLGPFMASELTSELELESPDH